jgi:hypothetical protein
MAKSTRRRPQTEPREEVRAEDAGEHVLGGGAALLADWNASLADFYMRRWQRYWQYPLALAELRSLTEVAESLVEFEKELMADYADQADEFQRIVRGEHRGTGETPVRQYEALLLKAQNDAAEIIEQAKAQAEHIMASAQSGVEQMAGRSAGGPQSRKAANG